MVEISNLTFAYADGDFVLKLPSLQIEKGESLAITGPSGSGKTTLLNLICGVLRADEGSIIVNGLALEKSSEKALRHNRITNIGMVFQSFELLEYLNVLDNILLPYRLESTLQLNAEVRQRAEKIAGQFGIADKLLRYPSQLSQGEKQRVAIARALITGAKLIVADEPTGNLDPKNTDHVADMLLAFAKEEGATLISVTHDNAFAQRFERAIDISDMLEGGNDA